MEFASVLLIVGALVIAGAVQACATGRIGVNPIAGIRLPSVMVSDAAWRAGHAAAVIPHWVTSGLAVVFAGFGLFGSNTPANMAMFVMIGAVILLGGTIWGAMVAHRAAVKVPLPKPQRKSRR